MAQVTRDEILAAIERDGGVRPCENCGKNGWVLPSASPESPMAEVLTMPLARDASRGLLLAPLVCQTCSNTRLLMLSTLLKRDIPDE